MLAANEAVAETMDREHRPVLYRIHEQPDPLKVEQFTEATRAMGLQLPPFELSLRPGLPGWWKRPRTRRPSTSSTISCSAPCSRPATLLTIPAISAWPPSIYLHFTSPIRRYPDLVAHRVLEQLLTRSRDKDKRPPILADNIYMSDAALHLSKRERVSVDVERNTQARLSALFLQERVGEEFAAIISGVASFGMFVELLDSFISGAVPLGDLQRRLLHPRQPGPSAHRGTDPPDLPDGRPAPGAAGARGHAEQKNNLCTAAAH